MSYDTSIVIDTGGEYPAEVEEVGNMTSNVGRMYCFVLPGPYEGGGRYAGRGDPDPRPGLPGLSGLRCSDAADRLDAAVSGMVDCEEKMRNLEPSNGWGSYEAALRYLKQITRACRRHPKATLSVVW